MTTHPNVRAVEALTQMSEEMEYLVAHPRIQQKTWVAKGKTWLPVLCTAQEDLQRDVNQLQSPRNYIRAYWWHWSGWGCNGNARRDQLGIPVVLGGPEGRVWHTGTALRDRLL